MASALFRGGGAHAHAKWTFFAGFQQSNLVGVKGCYTAPSPLYRRQSLPNNTAQDSEI